MKKINVISLISTLSTPRGVWWGFGIRLLSSYCEVVRLFSINGAFLIESKKGKICCIVFPGQNLLRSLCRLKICALKMGEMDGYFPFPAAVDIGRGTGFSVWMAFKDASYLDDTSESNSTMIAVKNWFIEDREFSAPSHQQPMKL